jgi:hypothetical protein
LTTLLPTASTMRLTLKTVPPRQGFVWVREGLSEFIRHPLGYAALFVAFMFAATVASLLPGLGGVLLLAGIPLLSLAYMMATVGSLRGSAPRLAVFLVPWRQLEAVQKRNLLVVCLSYALASQVIMSLCELFDHGALDQLMQAITGGVATEEEISKLAEAPGVLSGALARVLATMLLGVPYWHAPALVCWGGQSVGQALFSSVLALWRTKAAFVCYSLGWAGVMLAASTVLGLLLGALGNNALAGLVVMPVALGITGAYYVSLFFTFRDSFGQPEAAAEPATDAA